MKTTVAPYETSVKCLRIVCENGTVIRLTRYPFDLTMSNGQVYRSDAGYDFSSIVAETSFAASAVDLEGFVGVAGITRDMIASGVMDGARAYLFATSFLSPVEDHEPLTSSITGKTQLDDDRYTLEEMTLIDLLGQTVGETYSSQCKKKFGGQEFGGCKVDLLPLTKAGAVTSVTSSLVFVDSSRGESADYFGHGTVRFTSGANVGLSVQKIRDFASGGVFTLYEPPYYPLSIGDTYEAVAGCRKRIEDCQRHGNVARGGHFLHVPVGSTYRQVGGS